MEIAAKIKRARNKDKEIVRIVEEMKKVKVKKLQENEWQIEEDLVLKEGKVYMLKNTELRAKIVWLHYNVLAVGHRGQWKTVELVTRIRRYVKEYDLY